jgi:hypothetical protein
MADSAIDGAMCPFGAKACRQSYVGTTILKQLSEQLQSRDLLDARALSAERPLSMSYTRDAAGGGGH